MGIVSKALIFASATLLLIGFEFAGHGRQPATTTTTTVAAGVSSLPPAATTAELPPITTTTTIAADTEASAPSGPLCKKWWDLAMDVGWDYDDMETLDYIMWRESRCRPKAHNTTLNKDGSTDIGLTQINDKSWCLPTRWHSEGYLQRVGVLTTVGCEQLFDPSTNLKAAKAIHEYHVGRGDEGFEAWGL